MGWEGGVHSALGLDAGTVPTAVAGTSECALRFPEPTES